MTRPCLHPPLSPQAVAARALRLSLCSILIYCRALPFCYYVLPLSVTVASQLATYWVRTLSRCVGDDRIVGYI